MGSALQSMVVTSSQTVNIPANVSMMWAMGAGSGGGAGGSNPGGGSQGNDGGSAGEICHMVPMPVTPGGTLVVVINAAGLGQTGATTATPGGSVSAGNLILLGSQGRVSGFNVGGGPGGAQTNLAQLGSQESNVFFGGTSTTSAGASGLDGDGNGGNTGGLGSSAGRSGGGAGAFWPKGGDGATAQNANGSNATGYGAGGGGGGGGNATTGGNGFNGVIMLFWIG